MIFLPGLIILGIIIGISAFGYFKIKSAVRSLSRKAFGSDSFTDGYNKLKHELSQTPKSVSGMTRVYLPQIQADFPSFNYEEFKNKAEIMLASAFAAISSGKATTLKSASDDLKDKIALTISENSRQGRKESYDNVKIYQTEITNYKKQSGTCVITLQSAVSYKHYIEENGITIEGSRTMVEQTKYNTELVYIQDLEKVGSDYSNAMGTNCPNCGAPITNLGNKTCDYCQMAVMEINAYVWSISSFNKI